MSTQPIIEPINTQYKKIFTNINQKGKININHIVLNRNDQNIKLISENSYQKKLLKKERISPFQPSKNKLLSKSLLNKANDSMQNSKKLYLKSPLTLLKGVLPPSTHNMNINKNISLLPVNINKNISNKPLNNLRNVEYNSINCIINNFNLSCKNIDSHEENSKNSESILKLNKYYDFFDKRNIKLKNKMNNLKKNSCISKLINNIKNLSQLNDLNNSNINNVTNDNIKAEEIILENKKKKEKLEKINQEYKDKVIKLKELEKKNSKLKNDYQEIKIKHMEYSKSLERLYKFLRVLKKSGLDVNEMMDNISSGEDYDEYIDDDIEESEESQEEEKNETVLSDGSVLSNLKQLSSGLLRNHEEFSKGSKINLKLKIIPLLDLSKIKKLEKI